MMSNIEPATDDSIEQREDRFSQNKRWDKERAEFAEGGRRLLEDILTGETNELDLDRFSVTVELETILKQNNHLRLLRAASLAHQYWPRKFQGDTRQKFLKKIAAACQVDTRQLDAYTIVLGNEISYRERYGSAPLENLPKLSKYLPKLSRRKEAALSEGIELVALPSGSRAKHESWEYVELAEQGLNNRQIAEHLGDVTEASVRRGLREAHYKRAA
jgi:hypothetical protein